MRPRVGGAPWWRFQPFRRTRTVPREPLFLSREKLTNPSVVRGLLIVLASIGLAALVTPDLRIPPKVPELGQFAPQNIKAPGDFLVEDVESTQQEREEATEAVRAVYDFDVGAGAELEARVKRAFEQARSEIGARAEHAPVPPRRKGHGAAVPRGSKARKAVSESARPSPEQEAAIKRFREALGSEISREAVAFIVAGGLSDADEQAITIMVKGAMHARIVSNRELLEDEAKKGIVVRRVGTTREEEVNDLSAMTDLDRVRLRIREEALKTLADQPSGRRDRLVEIAQALVRPNLTFNRNETAERRARARESAKPVTIMLKKGEIIVRDGDPILPRHVMILDAIRSQSLRKSFSSVFTGAALLLFLTISLVHSFARVGVRKFRADMTSTVFLLVMLLLMALLTRFSLFMSEAVASAFPFASADSLHYAIPIASGAMIVRMILNSETTIFFAVILAVLASLLVERSLVFGLFTLLGSIVGAHGVAQMQSRSKILQSGFRVGLATAALAALWALMDNQLWTRDTLAGMACALAGGLVSAIVATGLTPVAEWALGTVTGLKLLELANRDQPLLRELALKAPGTYHHSMIMANLVEAAAEAIHANPLLARVSAYYHDIGKMAKPDYYVENMPPGVNKHDKLSPSMSSLIVQAHVKEGIELARKHRLPQVIVDAIPQHHGTSLIKYFYEKAVESVDPETDEVEEMDYRYPGPKPQSRECGLLMLADSAEAACRMLGEPNPTRVRGAVQKIINNIFRDGQLDECDLTLRDLNKIAQSFTETLSAIYHSRIEYPEPVAKGEMPRKKKGDEGPADRSAEPGKDKPKRGGETPKDDLKRLGMS
ncbi:MAG: hypothetical protein A2Y95_06320 [Deltaproteobacteria bacterium RBG_13_65_10]|nr:MAG: hypothetical protein A2Y95_06320 [Deltaproteobacteria bacterium RBG_13_65_10]